MKTEEFDKNDPWHVNAALIFCFDCQYCDENIYFVDVPECDWDKFEEACVVLTIEAKRRGWKYIQDFSFSCPVCSNKT